MKTYLFLIITVVLMAFSSGYIALSIKGSHRFSSSDYIGISKLLREFQQKELVDVVINLDSIYRSSNKYQLIDPLYALRMSASRNNFKYASNRQCFKGNVDAYGSYDTYDLLSQDGYKKTVLWEDYRCGKMNDIDNSFFDITPYMHPSGRSYAFLAMISGRNNFSSVEWIERHLSYFHVTELKEAKNIVGELKGLYGILVKFDNKALQGFSERRNVITSKEYILLRIKHLINKSTLEYMLYSRKSLDDFLRDTPYILTEYKKGTKCLYKQGALCWNYSFKHLVKLANKTTLLFFFGSIFLIVISIILIINKLKGQKSEEEKRRLALQVLTHEFRTPIASMLLQVERGNRFYESMNKEMKEVFMRLSSDVYRMQRLAEMSRNYLKIQKGSRNLIAPNIIEVNSVNQFIESTIENYDLEFIPLAVDQKIHIDIHWISVCIKNIVENALYHGTPPVKVTIEDFGENFIKVSITDMGFSEFKSIDKMSSPFIKGNKSQGTGLGLNIVRKVIRELGGKVIYSSNPTTFSLIIKDHV